MQQKYRSFPPAVPLKVNKLLQYQYFFEIYKKYDCNFFREILPYFSEIITTDKLETFKFIYVPIENPHKIKNIQIGKPFQPQIQNKNTNIYELQRQVTFIKITYQTHIIFQYLMNINLLKLGIQRLKFQDKFWLFTQGVIRTYKFNDIIFKNQFDHMNRDYFGLYFILDGQIKCFNKQNKPFKTIGKGYLVDPYGKIRKTQYQQYMSQIANKKVITNEKNSKTIIQNIHFNKDKHDFSNKNNIQNKSKDSINRKTDQKENLIQLNRKSTDNNNNNNKNKTIIIDNKIKIIQNENIYQDNQPILSVWSHSNNTKILFLDITVIKKYTNLDQNYYNQQNHIQKTILNKQNINNQIQSKHSKKHHIQNLMKYRRLKTQKQDFKTRKTYFPQNQISTQKFNLISCRLSNNNLTNKPLIQLISQISQNQILRSYTKDNEIYQKIKKQKLLNKHKRFFSNGQKKYQNKKQFQIVSLLSKQILDQKTKINIKKRNSKQLQNKLLNQFQINQHKKYSIQTIKQNQIFQSIQNKLINNKILNKNNEKQQKILELKGLDILNKQKNKNIKNNHIKKIHKSQLNTYQLLKRNFLNKQYHKNDFIVLPA